MNAGGNFEGLGLPSNYLGIQDEGFCEGSFRLAVHKASRVQGYFGWLDAELYRRLQSVGILTLEDQLTVLLIGLVFYYVKEMPDSSMQRDQHYLLERPC